MNFIKSWFADRKWDRKWKKEYGTSCPTWANTDLSNINELPKDPEFVLWYSNLSSEKKLKADRMINDAISFVGSYYDKMIAGIEQELIKRGNYIEPETTRD